MASEYDDLNVKHFKLSSGDEILGLVAGVNAENGVMVIEYPVLIEMVGKAYMMLDYMPTSVKNLVSFTTYHIIAQSDVHESVKQEYIKYCIGATEESNTEYDDEFEMATPPTDKAKYH